VKPYKIYNYIDIDVFMATCASHKSCVDLLLITCILCTMDMMLSTIMPNHEISFGSWFSCTYLFLLEGGQVCVCE